MELAWSPAALDDISAAADYMEYELANPMAAKRFAETVIEKAQLFADVPGSGLVLRTVNGNDTGYRYMLAGNWMVFLECTERRALVVRVLYAKSDYMKVLFGEIEDER